MFGSKLQRVGFQFSHSISPVESLLGIHGSTLVHSDTGSLEKLASFVAANPQLDVRSSITVSKPSELASALSILPSIELVLLTPDGVASMDEITATAEDRVVAFGATDLVHAREVDSLRPLIQAVAGKCGLMDRRDVDTGLVQKCQDSERLYLAFDALKGLKEEFRLRQLADKLGVCTQAVGIAWLLLSNHIIAMPSLPANSELVRQYQAASEIDFDLDDLAAFNDIQD